jgi:hypothetical protein
MQAKPVVVSASQSIAVALTAVERATLQVQRVHGQVTPQFLKRIAQLQGMVQQLAGLVAAP